jgi:hypothetical protein
VLAALLATIAPERVALAGLHVWTDDDYPNIAEWGLKVFSPDDLRDTSRPCSTGLPVLAARESLSISMSTPSIATR